MRIAAASASLTEGIEEIVSSIFENMLGLPTSSGGADGDGPVHGELHSFVRFTGSWMGMVSIECTRMQARHFAGRFLSLPVEGMDDRIACDVLGELTNMMAGNLKPLFASDIQLSTATVSSGKGEAEPDFHPEVLKELFFYCAEGSFLARVVAGPAHGTSPAPAICANL